MDLAGCFGDAAPSHPAQAVASFPGAEDLLDPATHPVDWLVPVFELLRDLCADRSPNARRPSMFTTSNYLVLRRPVESAQYLAMNYTQRLAEANLVPSVGSVGDSYDNVLAETINGLYKAAVIWRQRSWPSPSAVEMATLRWVDWFNNHRLFGPIGHIPPAEAEANYYAANETLDMVT